MSINLSRFTPDSKWTKILTRPDRKLQFTEFVEVQDMLNYHVSTNFSYLYSFYSITKGLILTLVSNGTITDEYILEGGQVYIESLEHGAFFLDIDSVNLSIPKIGKTSIGLLISFEDKDSIEYNDPISGGEVTGSKGAVRLLIDYSIILNNDDSYPIAVIDNTNTIERANIYYYADRQLNQNKYNISNKILKYISRRWFEEIGNFIADGFDVSYDTFSSLLTIQAGTAYINGYRIYSPYTKSFKINLSTQSVLFTRYLVTLNVFGDINIKSEDDKSNYTLSVSNDNISLANLDIYKEVISQFGYPINKVVVTQSNNRILTVPEIISLEEENELNEDNIIQLYLDSQTLDKGFNNNLNLSGILTDSLQNLNKSDINNLLYSASLVPSINAVRANYLIKNKDISNLILDSSNSNISNNYATISYSNNILTSQFNCTDWIELSLDSQKQPTMLVSPNKQTLNNNNILSNISLLRNNTSKDIKTNNKIISKTIKMRCYGFNPNEDNLILTFGNLQISQFKILVGVEGTTFSSIKASSDGSVEVDFVIPGNLDSQNYTINLTNNTNKATATYHNEETSVNYNGILSGIAQTFLIEKPVIIPSIKLKFREINQTSTVSYAVVSLVKADYNLPTNDCLAIGIVNTNNITTSNNGKLWTEVFFDEPAYILTRGTYAIVVTPLINGGQLFYADSGKTDLLTGRSSTNQSLINGDLLIKLNDIWQVQSGKDLAFELLEAIPSSLTSEIIYKIKDTEEFNAVEFSVPYTLPSNTSVEFYYNENFVWKLIQGNNFRLQFGANNVLFKIKLIGNTNLFPFVELDNINIQTIKNNLNGSWISVTANNEKEYTNCEIEFEGYIPDGTSIIPKISSNNGYSWEGLTYINKQLIDGNIPLYKYSYSSTNLSRVVNLTKDTEILRTKLTLRLDFSSTNTNIVPFAKNISSIVY